MKKILLLVLVLGTFSLTSCRSKWSCQKRYVNNKPYNFNKHYVLTNFDKMMLKKYNIKAS